jgi:hypothetical protein
LIVISATCVALTGCASIFHLDEYSTSDAGASLTGYDSSAEGAVPDASGAADAGADQCTDPSVTGACASGACVPFDNTARIQGFVVDAALPMLPDAGATDAATEGGGGGEGSGDGGGGGGDGGKEGGGGDGGAGGAGQDASASGLPACSSLPTPVYVMGSSGLSGIASELGTLASTVPITVVYVSAHSCDGAKAIVINETATQAGATTANYWDVSGTIHTCQLDSNSQYADIGMSNVFPEQCLSLPMGASGIGDFRGPVTPGVLVVPTASSQKSMSAEALYYTVGLGTGAVAPWTSPSFVYVSGNSGGVQLDFGLDVGVPSTQWQGAKVSTSAQNIASITTSPQPEMTLGTMSTDQAESDSTSTTVKQLAYQDFGQDCGYYPNSTETAADKRNVRDGHYAVWGFTHMFSKVNAQSVPLNSAAATIIGYFTGNLPTPSGNFLKYVINTHLVPTCAMQVTRSAEMGPLTPYDPPDDCGCYFDSITTGNSSCQTCSTSTDCPASAPKCNLGFCEAH